jgi:hypothetical protein
MRMQLRAERARERGPSGADRRCTPRKVVAGSLFAATATLLGSPPDHRSPRGEPEVVGRCIRVVLRRAGPRDGRQREPPRPVLVPPRGGLAASGLRRADRCVGQRRGAIPVRADVHQPFRNGSYDIAARSTPLDPTFLDSRFALAFNWKQPVGDAARSIWARPVSTEYDYFPRGVNARYSIDLNQRNTSLDIGLAYASDSVDPVGGAPVPFAAMLPEGARATSAGRVEGGRRSPRRRHAGARKRRSAS